jgi:hypothetical protein
MHTYSVSLIGGLEDEIASVTTETPSDCCHLTFQYRDKMIKESAEDYFEALCKIRLQLEVEGLIPFCYGASLNVFPSGMSRSMGSGLSAYRFTQGRPALRADIVRIFDSGPDVIPSTVSKQRENYDAWIKSLTQTSN